MGTKPASEKETVQEDIVWDGDGIFQDVHEQSDQSAVHLTPDPYSDIKDVVSDAWSVNYKEPRGLTSLITKLSCNLAKGFSPILRRARE